MRKWSLLLLSVLVAIACARAVDNNSRTESSKPERISECAPGSEAWLIAPHSSLQWKFAHEHPSISLSSDPRLFEDELAGLSGTKEGDRPETSYLVQSHGALVPGRIYNVAVTGDEGVFEPDAGRELGEIRNSRRLCFVVSGVRIDEQETVAGSPPLSIRVRGVVQNLAQNVELHLDAPDGPLVGSATVRSKTDGDDECGDHDSGPQTGGHGDEQRPRLFEGVASVGDRRGPVRIFAVADGEFDAARVELEPRNASRSSGDQSECKADDGKRAGSKEGGARCSPSPTPTPRPTCSRTPTPTPTHTPSPTPTPTPTATHTPTPTPASTPTPTHTPT